MRRVILLNGVPASGKTALSRPLIAGLRARGVPAALLALDTIKEALFTEIGTGDRDYNRMLGRASYRAIFDTIAAFEDSLVPVVDAWHGFQPIEVLRDHLARARIDRVVEVWVSVAPHLAAERYRARAAARPQGHLPASYANELRALAAMARPLGLDRVIAMDGAQPLGEDLPARVLAALNDGET